VLRETTSRGPCGLVCPSRTSERGGEGDCVKEGGGGKGKCERERASDRPKQELGRPCCGSRFFPTVRFLKLKHTPPPPTCAVHQVTLGSCIRCLLDSLQSTIGGAHEDLDPIVYSSIQSSLHLIFSSSSKHGTPDCLRPCCHMLHSIIVSPFIRHCLSACCPLSMFRW